MEALFALAAIGLAVVVFVLPLILFSRVRRLESTLKLLSERLLRLEGGTPRPASPPVGVPAAAAAPPASAPPSPARSTDTGLKIPEPAILQRPPRTSAVPPPLPSGPVPPPPPLPPSVPPPRPVAIDWEAFMGVKLFAWIGGFVLFLGLVFLVKYSFQNNLISPRTRVLFGGTAGLALLLGGWRAARSYRVPGQSLCATGVLVLYATIFAAQSFYGLLSLPVAFALMAAVTVAAFALAVRLHAQVVAVLGLLGGFVTPVLLATGQDNAPALFTYVALLNAGIAAVALRKGWSYLIFLAALGTLAMEYGWALEHFDVARAPAACVIFLGFQLQFLLISFIRRRAGRSGKWTIPAGVAAGFGALFFAPAFLSHEQLGFAPLLFFSLIFAADLGLVILTFSGGEAGVRRAIISVASGLATFLLLATWTLAYLDGPRLWWGLGAFLLFAGIHALPILWPRAPGLPGAARPLPFVPLLSLGLIVLVILQNQAGPAVWAGLLLLDALVIVIALRTRTLAATLTALLLTIGIAALWIVTAPADLATVPEFLVVSAGFGVFFFGATLFVNRRAAKDAGDWTALTPALAAALPFALVAMVVEKMSLPDPTAVFAVIGLLAVLLLGLGVYARRNVLAAIALVCAWAIAGQWHLENFAPDFSVPPLSWYAGLLFLFLGYPYFVAEKRAALPWAVSAGAGALFFWLIYQATGAAYPAAQNGLLPAAFVVPFALGVYYLRHRVGLLPATGAAALAWQGGAGLFFVALIFPVQFDREWITLGWALEGLALIWLFRKVPHRGLRVAGTLLLAVAFARLALNPEVWEYHPRAPLRLWNWYLYAYGVTTLCLLAGARLFGEPRPHLLERAARPFLYTLGTLLAFLLLNIEIADYFSIGPTLTFSFSGDFARDMTYSIAWALFAFVLLLVGMWLKSRAARYAGLALLLVTLAKLFLHDLANLGQLYRIGAFIGVALVLIIASFIYQRFLSRRKA